MFSSKRFRFATEVRCRSNRLLSHSHSLDVWLVGTRHLLFCDEFGGEETNLPIFRKFFVKIIFFCKFFMSSDTVAPFFLLLIKDTNCTNLLSILHYFTLGMEA